MYIPYKKMFNVAKKWILKWHNAIFSISFYLRNQSMSFSFGGESLKSSHACRKS